MIQQTNEPVIKHTPAAADAAQKTGLGAFKIPTSALRAYTMVLALIVVWLLFTWATGGVFLEARNFSNLMRQTAVTGVLAVGMLMVIVSGHIDLSVGSVAGLTGGIAAMLLTWLGWGLVPSLAAAVVVGAGIGLAQGTLVAYANVPAFIVTLGGLLIWRGVIKGVSRGSTIPVELRSFKFIGQGYVAPLAGIAIRIVIPSAVIVGFILALNSYAGVPIPVIILLAVALAGAFLTQNTTFGRYLYAIGSNRDAARLSGIRVRRHILVVFCLMGALAAVSGIIYTARVGSGSPDAGVLLELDAIAACVIGGASLMGGRGTIFGACLGALFMASLDNGMSLKNIRDFMQDIIKGSILVAAVGLDIWWRRKS